MENTPVNTPAANVASIQRGKPFKKGESGNPLGKKRGTRHKATLAMQTLLEGEGEKLTRKAVELALAGDTTALRLCMERILPTRKELPIALELPVVNSASDALIAMTAILEAVADAMITPSEGKALTDLVTQFAKVLEVSALESRIVTLENIVSK